MEPASSGVAPEDETLGTEVPEFVQALVIFEDTAPGPEPAENPVTLMPALEDGSAVTAVVRAAEGGTIEATGPDGSTFILDIPATALIFDTEITMTPIAAVELANESGDTATLDGAIGVQLLPAGLHLLDLATLRVEPGGDAAEWAVIVSEAGEDARLYPSTTDGGTVEIPVTHFSEKVVVDGIEIPPLVEDSTPTTEQAQLERDIVDAHDDGEVTDAEVDEIADRYGRTVDWIIALAATNCAMVEAGELARAASLMHTMSATGFIDDESVGEFQVGMAEALLNCIEELEASNCFSPMVPAHAARLIALTRMAQLLGAPEDVYQAMVERLSERVVDPESGLALAYRVEIVQSYTAAHDTAIATDVQEGMDEIRGDIVAIGNGRYCGRLVATSTGTQTGNSGIMTQPFIGDQECTRTWDGRQTVNAVGRVMSPSEIPSYMEGGTAGRGELHIALYLTTPAGGVEWADADGECVGGVSEVLNLDFVGEELQGSAIGAAVPRLPADDLGASMVDVFDYDGPGLFGPMTSQEHFTITTIVPTDVEIPRTTRGGSAGAAGAGFAANIQGGPHAGDYEGAFGTNFESGALAECSTGISDEVSFNGFDAAQDPSSIYVRVYDLGTGETERFEVLITFGDGAELADTIYISPDLGEGTGTATAERIAGRAQMHVEGESTDGVSVELDVSCTGSAE